MEHARTRSKAKSALTRYLAQLCAVWCVVGLLSSALHYLVVPHYTCAHGEQVHGTPDGYRAAPQTTSADFRASILPSGAAEHEHDHCAVASARFVQQHAGIAFARAPAECHYDGVQPYSAILRLAIIGLAPKTSPPV